MASRDEHDLVRRLRAGDAAAFAEVDAQYRRPLTSFAERLLGSTQDAEDVVQESLARTFEQLRREPRDVALGPWLYRVVRNSSIDVLRRRQARSAALERLPSPDHSANDAHAEAVGRERLRAVVDDVGRLPRRQREAVVLACVEGLPHEEVARRLDTSVLGTKSLLVRARANLARMSEARAGVAERARDALAVVPAMTGKLLASSTTAGTVVVAAVAVGGPAVLVGPGAIVGEHTMRERDPAPRELSYGPFRIAGGSPLPVGMALEEATVRLPAGEERPRARRLILTCPPGFVQAGISASDGGRHLVRLDLAHHSARRIGSTRRAAIVFRPRAGLHRAQTVRLGIECNTPERFAVVGAGYGAWAECRAITKLVNRLRRRHEHVPRDLRRAQSMDCEAAPASSLGDDPGAWAEARSSVN